MSINRQLRNANIDTVIAIDVGTYGYAVSYSQFLKDDVISPPCVVSKFSDQDTLEEVKYLCAILIEVHTNKTVAIGFYAWTLYLKKCERKKEHNYMYFQHPYWLIHKLVEVDDVYNFRVTAIDKHNSLPLATVIIKLYKAIMEEALYFVNAHHILSATQEETCDDVFWVIPIPVLWFYSVQTTNFIEYCLCEAGMKQYHVCGDTIAATYYVKNNLENAYLNNKSNRVILDCGAKSINALTVTMDNEHIYDIHSSETVFCGSMDIAEQFGLLLEDVLPEDIINRVQNDEAVQWNTQLMEFNSALKCLPSIGEWDKLSYWNVSFCFGINRYIRKEKRKMLQKKSSSYNQTLNKVNSYSVNEEGDKLLKLGRCDLKIAKKGWEYLHERVLNKTVAFCRNVFGDCKDLMLVGDFAKSEWLKEKLKCEFPNQSFWCLERTKSHLAVVNGALYCAAAVIKSNESINT